jgi:plasmid maintenance system antidote protein VapI
MIEYDNDKTGTKDKFHILTHKHPPHEWRMVDSWYDDEETAESVFEIYERMSGQVPEDNISRGKLLKEILLSAGITQRRFAFSIGVTRHAVERMIYGWLSFPSVRFAEATLMADRMRELYAGTSRHDLKTIRAKSNSKLDYPNLTIENISVLLYNDKIITMSEEAKASLLFALIDASGLRPTDFAPLIGYTRGSLYSMLKGRYAIKSETLTRAADALQKVCLALRPLRTLEISERRYEKAFSGNLKQE